VFRYDATIDLAAAATRTVLTVTAAMERHLSAVADQGHAVARDGGATASEIVERRRRYWHRRQSIIAEALRRELAEPGRQSMARRAFLYREKFVCTTMIVELDRIANELDGHA